MGSSCSAEHFNTREHFQLPDIRQAICHSIVAAGFSIINVQNPFKENFTDNPLHLIILIAMLLAAVFSWYVFFKRLEVWKKIPSEIKNRITRTPIALKNRALSHMIMALLAAGLTALGYLGHYVKPLALQYNRVVEILLLFSNALIGVLAIAVLARTIRDLITFFTLTKA